MAHTPQRGSLAAKTNEQRAARVAQFEQWRTTFRRTTAGLYALNTLRSITLDAGARRDLGRALLLACFHAHCYRVYSDDSFRQRGDDLSAFTDSLPKQRDALETLMLKASAYPAWVSQALRAGGFPIEARPRRAGSRVTFEPYEVLLGVLRSYHDGLAKLDSAKSMLVAHVEGCLRYPPQPARKRMRERDPGALQSLLFELTLLLRRWTAGGDLQLRDGTRMPSTGSPHYDIVAAFTQATFAERPNALTGAEVRDRLRKLLAKYPALSYMPWHDDCGNLQP